MKVASREASDRPETKDNRESLAKRVPRVGTDDQAHQVRLELPEPREKGAKRELRDPSAETAKWVCEDLLGRLALLVRPVRMATRVKLDRLVKRVSRGHKEKPDLLELLAFKESEVNRVLQVPLEKEDPQEKWEGKEGRARMARTDCRVLRAPPDPRVPLERAA